MVFRVFLVRAYGPHAVLCVAMFVVCAYIKFAPPANGPEPLWVMLVTLGVLPVSWYASDFLLTYRKSDTAILKRIHWILLILYGLCIPFSISAFARIDPFGSTFSFMLVDLVTWTGIMGYRGAYGKFLVIWPEIEEKLREQQQLAEKQKELEVYDQRLYQDQVHRNSARAHAQAFYDQHRVLLTESFPPALFQTCLNAAIPDTIEPKKAWSAAKKLIEKVHPLVAHAQEIHRLEEQQRQKAANAARKTQDEIEALQQRIGSLQSRTDDEALDEIIALQRRAAQLQGQRLRQTITPDDL